SALSVHGIVLLHRNPRPLARTATGHKEACRSHRRHGSPSAEDFLPCAKYRKSTTADHRRSVARRGRSLHYARWPKTVRQSPLPMAASYNSENKLNAMMLVDNIV